MDWESDVSAGAWIIERTDDSLGTIHSFVPRGFEAYARIFHPASVDSLPGVRLPSGAEIEQTPASVLDDQIERLTNTPTTWAETAVAFGTTMHPLAQWQRIVRTPPETDWQQRTAPDGRRFNAPEEGWVAPELLATLVGALTTGPTPGHAAIWEGFGGLLSLLGTNGRSFFSISETSEGSSDPEVAWRHQQLLNATTHDPFNAVFQQPSWQDGILSREISEGPRLELPARSHVVFRGDLATFRSPDWILDVPWRDRPMEAQGFPASALSPTLMWPDDRSWVLASEIDFDSTVVGGSRDLINRLLATPDLEVAELDEGAELHWDGDTINPR